jgi:nitronate monooxygenase
MRDVLRTALCDLLGIEYPIIQSGMANVAGPDLVAEVSRAGGLGILAGLGVPPDELRARIRHVRERTDRPFGVNLWLHTELRPPADPASISDERLAAVQGVLNGFRAELGLPAQSGRPPAIPDLIPAQIEMLLEERPAVFSIGLGDPGSEAVDRCHERGIKVIAMVATVEDARTVAASGVDVVTPRAAAAATARRG